MKKRAWGIEVTVGGKVALVKPVQLVKAPSPK